jgi:acyl transferase domain-containing protein/surfactin synthase thioesterase subunit
MIRLEKIPAYVPLELSHWTPTDGKSRIAGISSFGFSGTNAHVIISEPPAPEKSDSVSPDMPLSLLTLSAKSDSALNRLANAYLEHLQANPDISIRDLCYTANACRSHFSHRAAFIAGDTEQMIALLNAYIEGEQAATSNQQPATSNQKSATKNQQPKIAFLFPDDDLSGTRELYDLIPEFREKIQWCGSRFEPYFKSSVLEWLYSDSPSCPEDVKEACLFSVGYAMSGLLQSWGILPDAVWGQKTGNYAAACAAGILSPETAIRHIAGDWNNLPDKTCHPPQCRFIGSETGKPVKKKELTDPAYWRKHSDSPASPENIVAALSEQGYGHFLILGHYSKPAEQKASRHRILKTYGSWETLLQSLSECYCAGADIRWAEFYRDTAANKILLPTYPFERKRYWSPLKPRPETQPETKAFGDSSDQGTSPLEGSRVFSPLNEKGFEYRYEMNLENLPQLKDTHGIFHVGYCQEVLRRAVKQSFGTAPYLVKKTDFISALILSENENTAVHLLLEPGPDRETAFKFYSRTGNNERWELHITGKIELNSLSEFSEYAPESLDQIKKRCPENCSGLVFYHQMQTRGINLGPAVQWVEEIWYGEGEALARFRNASDQEKHECYAMQVNPGIFDACAQIFHAALWKNIPQDTRFMVVKWTDFACAGNPGNEELWCHAVLDKDASKDGSVFGRFDLFDQKGRAVASCRGNLMKGLSRYNVRELKKIRDAAKTQEKGVNKALMEELGNASAEEKKNILTQYFQEVVSAVLDMPASEISINESLRDMGLDSMTGLQFKTRVEHELDIDIPIEDIIQGPSIFELSESAVQKALSDNNQQPTPNNQQPTPNPQQPTPNPLWFAHRKPKPEPAVRLFCLPYGGGGASLYRRWQDKFPDHIEVCPVQLPGRENRLKEKPICDINEITERLETVIQPELDRAYAFYGHSMGALIAFRLAYRLWQNAEIKPARLFTGGFTAPIIYPNPLLKRTGSRIQSLGFESIPDPEQISEISDEQFDAFADAFPGLRKLSEGDGHLLKKVLVPIFVSDLKLVDSYQPRNEEPFDIPITAFHAKNDEHVTEDETKAWKNLTAGTFNMYILPGDHLFLHEDQAQAKLLELISRELETN